MLDFELLRAFVTAGPRPTRSILFRVRRCRWPCIASDPFLARLHSPRSTTTN
jgi:hypothetical protein